MTTRDQLEIIGPGGDIRFYDLNPVKGFTNIGSHPDNDVVIPSPDVAAFHAVIDHRQRPCHIINMGKGGPIIVGGQAVQPNASHTINNWDTIELNGHTIVLMEGVAGGSNHPAPAAAYIPLATPAPQPAWEPTPPPSPAPPPTPIVPVAVPIPAQVDETPIPSLPPPDSIPPISMASGATIFDVNAPVPDQADELILLEITARDFTLDVDQSASFDVTIINGGPLVATFDLRQEGLDPFWVVSPASVNLYEGERATVTVTISPPREPSSRAGMHYFGVIVTSPELPGHRSQIGGTLTVNPYFDHTVTELSPRQQRIDWFRRNGKVMYSVGNRGNSDTGFRLDASDDERLMQFEFKLDQRSASLAKQAELKLKPEETRPIEVLFAAQKRIFFGFANQQHTFTVTTSPLQGALPARSLLGQVENVPLIGPIHVFLLVALILLLIAIIFRPSITDVTADPDEIISGQEVTLNWDVSPFADVTLDHDLGSQGRGDGELVVKPLVNTTYLITVSTPLLGNLIPFWFTDTEVESVIVDPLYPIVRVELEPDQIVAGDSTTLRWEIYNADEAVLIINGALESIEPEQFIGSRSYTPEGGGDEQVTFEVRASNRYDTRSDSAVLNAIAPTPTPWPKPVITRFDVSPSTIVVGEEVTLEWNVSGAEKVRIDPGGQEFPPIGKVVLKPEQSTPYTLTAINGPVEAVAFREVIVNPAPTPTPVPGTPIIDFFTGTPLEVAFGSAEASNVQLAWSVSGDMTDLELSGDTIGTISGLPREGTQAVSVGNEDTKFTLTAYNDELNSSQTVEIKVVVPVPVISSLSPASTTNVGGSGFSITVSGANFANGSTVRWNGSDRPTNFLNSTTLSASITSADIEEAGPAEIIVVNPAEAGGGESGTATFFINNPVPVIANIDPSEAVVGSGDVTVVISGSSFVATSKARWNGVDVTTTYNSPNTLTAVIPEDKLKTGGTGTISVFTATPGGGASGAKVFTIKNPKPAITSLGPPSFITVGSDTFTLTINGTGFVGGSTGSRVSWDGLVRSAVFVSDTQLQYVVPADDVDEPGTVEVAVINSVPGGGPSDPVDFEIRRAPANIVLSASPASGVAVTGQSITFIAVVSPAGSTPYTPTGTVTFMQGPTTLGTGTLAGNPATASIGNVHFGAGDYDITATYSGDVNYAPKTSTVLNYVVSKGNVSIQVSALPNPATLGSAVTFNAFVNPTSPASSDPSQPNGGQLQFLMNGTPIGPTRLVTSGFASYSIANGNTDLSGGNLIITATYDGSTDTNFNSGSTLSSYVLQVQQILPSVSVSAPTTTFGQAATFSATVTSSTAGYSPANGAIVTFKNGAAPLGTATLSGCSPCTATFPAGSSFPAGSYTINADYDGGSDPNFQSASGSATFTVNQASTTTFAPGVNPNSVVYKTTVTYTSSVTSSVGIPNSATDSISFYYGSGSLICTDSSLSAGTASCTSDAVPAGNHNVYAVYNGEDPNYLGSQSTTTALAVSEASTSTNFFFMSPSNTTYGTSVSFSASVSSSAGVPTGTISFYNVNIAQNICTAAISAGTASCSSTSNMPGTGGAAWPIRAIYNGEDSNFLGSTSADSGLTISAATPSISINACPTPTSNNQAYTYTITLTGTTTAPTGTVTFFYQTHYPSGSPNSDSGYTYSQTFNVTVPSSGTASVSVSDSSFVWVTGDKRSRVTFTFNSSNTQNYANTSTFCFVDGP